MDNRVRVRAIFAFVDDFLSALRTLQERQVTILAVHSPVPNRQIAAILRDRPSPVRYITLTGAILGIVSGVSLAVYTAWQWRFVVSGKPPVPNVPYVIEGFEFCILFAVLANIGGLLLLSRLPRLRLPGWYDPRLSEDRFCVVIDCPTGEGEALDRLLHDHGAEEVHVVA